MLRATLRKLARGPTRRPSLDHKAPRARPRQPALEELESRFAPAVTVSVLGGVLTAQCDSGFNTVTVDHFNFFRGGRVRGDQRTVLRRLHL
jgi:hypothetical protein